MTTWLRSLCPSHGSICCGGGLLGERGCQAVVVQERRTLAGLVQSEQLAARCPGPSWRGESAHTEGSSSAVLGQAVSISRSESESALSQVPSPQPLHPPPPGIHRYSKGPERCREQRHRFLCPSPNMPPPPTFLKDSANATIAPRSDFEIVRIYMII